MWNVSGFAYVGAACFTWLRMGAIISYPGEMAVAFAEFHPMYARYLLIVLIVCIVASKLSGYVADQFIGGPKIASTISSSGTWTGIACATLATGALLWFLFGWNSTTEMQVPVTGVSIETIGNLNATTSLTDLTGRLYDNLPLCILVAFLVASVAQAGTFFVRWMKRRAGVQNSGMFVPGHSGLFDYLDGMVAVSFMIGSLFLSGLVRP
jgi:phosphatidate cytidylyltransferase